MAFIKDLFSSPDPPPPVDYGAIGQQQEAANLEAARVGVRIAQRRSANTSRTNTLGR